MLKIRFSNKRGMGNQIDWAISLAIFLLFIIWFFVVLRQFAPVQLRLENRISIIEEKLKSNVTYTYSEIPIIVNAQKSLQDYPVLLNDPVTSSSMLLDEGIYFLREGGSLFFIADLDEGYNVFTLKSSDDIYQQVPPESFISFLNPNVLVNSKSYSASFPDYFLNAIYYNSTRYLYNFEILIDGYVSEITDANYQTTGIFIQFNQSSEWFSMNQYVYSDYPMVQTNVDISETYSGNHTFFFDFTVPELPYYYYNLYSSDNNLDTTTGCISFESDVLDLTDDNMGILFKFDRELPFSICDSSNSTHDTSRVRVQYNYSSSLSGSQISFLIYSHDGIYADIYKDFISSEDVTSGTIDSYKGISKTLLDNLKNFDVKELRNQWNVSDEFEFSIDVRKHNTSSIFYVESSDPQQKDVFTRSFSDYLIDSYGNKETVFITVGVWE